MANVKPLVVDDHELRSPRTGKRRKSYLDRRASQVANHSLAMNIKNRKTLKMAARIVGNLSAAGTLALAALVLQNAEIDIMSKSDVQRS